MAGGADPKQIIAAAYGARQFYESNNKDPQYRVSGAKFISSGGWKTYLGQREAKEYLARPELRVVG